EPVVAVTGILEQNIVGAVARSRSAGLEKDIEVAVAIPVGECHAVPLLKVSGSRGQRHILEPETTDVLKQDVRYHVTIFGPACSQVHVEVAVVVEIAEVRSHANENAVETGLGRDVSEPVGPLVTIQARPLAVGRLIEVAADDVGEPIAEVRDEQVEP